MAKLIIIAIAAFALIAGAGIYYTNHYAYLERFEPAEITLINRTSGESETIAFADMSAIRASSTPLRFRACFTVSESVDTLAATYLEADKPEPLVAPNSFRCFDANAIGGALERGEARAFVSQRDIAEGIDRLIAVFPDGRAYAWHQLNDKFQD